MARQNEENRIDRERKVRTLRICLHTCVFLENYEFPAASSFLITWA
jgi:hypothetical protein